MGGGSSKPKAKAAISLRVIDDLDHSFQFPAPQAFPQLLTDLAAHYHESEDQLQCYSSGLRPIDTQEGYDALLRAKGVIHVRLMASLSDYLESISQTFGKDFTLDESEEQSAGPFVVSPAQGYMQIWAVGAGEYKRQAAPFLDIQSRIAVTETGKVYISGGSNRPDLFCCLRIGHAGLTILPPLAKGRGDHAMCLHNSAIVILGGFFHRPIANCQSFEAETWSPLPSLTHPRYGHSCISSSDSLYVIGGIRSTYIEQLQEGGRWRELEVEVPLAHPGLLLTEEGELMIIGGGSPRAQSKVYCLTLDTWAVSEMPDLPRPDTFRGAGLEWEECVYLIGTAGRYTLQLENSEWAQL